MSASATPLDGNSAAGLFSEVFSVDLTVARATCAGCETVGELGALRMWAVEMGAVLRCPACGSVVIRLTSTPAAVWIDASGARSIAIPKRR
jgi:uncharacterized protein DUF6510